MEIGELKKLAGETAVTLAVKPGMVLGLGTGSTAVHAVRKIGQLWQAGKLPGIVGIPTSEQTRQDAASFGIPLGSLAEYPAVAVTIDGADEVDPHFNLIKGLGGALLREKIVAAVSKRLIVVADDRKKVTLLGTRAPVPVEVIPFAERPVTDFLTSLGALVVKRLAEGSERPYRTDENNLILDCTFPGIPEPAVLAQQIKAQPGVVEHGLFLNLATDVVWATPAGVEIASRH